MTALRRSISRAQTFDEAWDLLGTKFYDLAILDIMGVSGYDILEMAKEKEVPTLMLTAHALTPEHLKKSIQNVFNSKLVFWPRRYFSIHFCSNYSYPWSIFT